MNLPRFSVQNPVVVHLLLFGIIAFGVVASLRVRRELLPDTTPDAVTVRAAYPGASPAELESAVVLPLEEALQAVEGVETLRSTAREGHALLSLTLERGVDPERVLRKVDAELENVSHLPEEVTREGLQTRYIEPRLPAISISIHGRVGLERLRRATEELEDALLRDPLISTTDVLGIPDREVSIWLDPRRLEELNLQPQDVAAIVSQSNRDEPAGVMRSDQGETLVRSLGRRQTLAELASLPIVHTADGGLVRLQDLAQIEIVWVEPRVVGSFNGEEAARIVVFRAGDEDVLAIARRVREIVAATPVVPGISTTVHNDLARYVDERIELMTRNGRTGLLLVFICLALFLSFRLSFWVALGIPVSFLATLIVMGLTGLTLNLISLFGLIVVLGMIVDDAIVIGENTYRHFEAGLEADEAAIRGAREVSWPVIAAVLTSIAAFLPMMMVEGRLGDVIRPLPLVVSVALLVSLVEALLLLPCHLARSLRRTRRRRKLFLHRWLDLLQRRVLDSVYGPLLRGLLAFRWATVLALVCLTALSLVVGVYLVPFHLSPDAEADAVFCQVELPVGEPLSRTREVVQRIESLCRAQLPEIQHIYSLVGVKQRPNSLTGSAEASLGAHFGQVFIELKGSDARVRSSAEILSQLRTLTGNLPELTAANWDAVTGNPTGPDIEIEVRGDGARLETDVALLETALASLSGVQDIKTDAESGKSEVRLRLRHFGRVLGMTEHGLAAQVRGALHGLLASSWREPHGQIDVVVRYVESALTTPGQLAGLYVYTPSGDKLPLREVAELVQTRGQGLLNRVDRKRAVTVFASVDRRQTSALQVVESLSALPELAEIDLRFRGEQFESQKSMGSLWVVTLVACVLIYVILAAVFRSYSQPLIVMAAIPFALIGIIFGHLLLGMEISFMSLIGIVALCGIVVNDSLILVDFINVSRRAGGRLLESVVEAAKKRVRPIVLTSLTTVAGLAPLMTETSFQARFIIPMAVSLSFGLVFATVLTLVAVPCLYLMLDDLRGLLAAPPAPARSPSLTLKGGGSQVVRRPPEPAPAVELKASGEGPAFAAALRTELAWDDDPQGDVELSGEFDLLDAELQGALASQVVAVPPSLLGHSFEEPELPPPPEPSAADLVSVRPGFAAEPPRERLAQLQPPEPPLPPEPPPPPAAASSDRAEKPRPRRPRRPVAAEATLRPRKQRMHCPGCGNRVKFAPGKEGVRVRHACGAKFTLKADRSLG